MAEKSYRPWNPSQSYLLPPSPLEWLPEGHLAYFILEIVGEFDLTAIEEEIQRKDARGERPYSPAMMVALMLYSYSTGRFSSRRIARGTYEDVALRVIGGEEHPHFTTINQFRLEHWGTLAGLFAQGFQMCQKAGLVTLGQVALDGTKIKAAASKHKAMSYQRMGQDEIRLRGEIEALLRRAQQVDEEEDRRYGPGQDPEDLPTELARREQRLERIRAAKAELEKEAAAARAAELREQAAGQRAKADDESVRSDERKRAQTRAEKAEQAAEELKPESAVAQDAGEAGQQELPLHQVASEPEGKPKPLAQRNFTDPASRIMVKDGAFIQAYNAQFVVDGASQVIIAQGVSNQAPDQEYLLPMVERMLGLCEQRPEVLLADSGYFSQENVQRVQGQGIEPFIAVGRESKSDLPSPGGSTPAQQIKASMAEKLREGAGKAIYARRKAIVEPVFGQVEQGRGFRRFSQRGMQKVRHEWAFICLTHNLLKLFRNVVGQRPTGRLTVAAWSA
jgi:transposase